MEIINSIYNFNPDVQTYATIGTFDGVHIGHQKIIKKLVDDAKKNEKKSVLLTFFPHPRMVLQKEVNIKLIQTIEERTIHLKNLGLDYLIIHPFSKEFSKLSALSFVEDILVGKFNISKLIIGYDHHFGKNKEGNINQLTEAARKYNFKIEEIAAQDINEVAISSTKIRKALLGGEIELANRFLNYHFNITGKVVYGKQLGGKIGFPTANINVAEPYKLIPKTGVYAVTSIINNKTVFGMMNIGNRPTLAGDYQTIEIHFFDFDKNLYDATLTISFLHFIREEQKFNTIDDLIVQLKKDEQVCRSYILNKKLSI